MKRFPFYHEEFVQDTTPLKDWEINKRAEHAEIAKSLADYRKQEKFDQQSRRGMKVYNVVQTARPDDEVSRIFLGLTRSVIDRGHEQMTEGEPGFSFAPKGPSDRKKVLLWENLVQDILSDCDYGAHQSLGFRDLLTMGSVVMEQYCDYPYRILNVPNDKFESGYEPVRSRDFRRPMVGVRHVNPMDAWRAPIIDNPTQVPYCIKRRVYTWNQFAVDVANSMLQNGDPRYKNLWKLQKGTHVVEFTLQNELTDEFCKYYVPTGTDEEGNVITVPSCDAIKEGIPMFYKPLKIHEIRKGGKTLRSDGLNIPGICSLRWGTYFDAYDSNYRGTHSVYGMGIPQRIEAEDMSMQMIFNMNLDNYRMANMVALNYQGNNLDSYLDIDANRFYGGEVIDGIITPQSFGISRIGDYQAMRQDLEEGVVPATGINHRAIVGDASKTATEFVQRIRLMNRSAEQTLQRLENELFKPLGRLLLGGALSNLTEDEWEDMTEDQVEAAKSAVKSKRATMEDYEGLDGKEPRRRVKKYIRVRGEKLKEDFSKSSKRNLDFYSTNHTLVKDNRKSNEDSFVPLVYDYIVPAEYIESGLLPDVKVETKRMLSDMKALKEVSTKGLLNIASQLAGAGLIDPQSIDGRAFIDELASIAGVDTEQFFKGMETGSKRLEMMKKLKESSPTPNAAPPIDIGKLGSISEESSFPQDTLQRTAQSTL